MSPTTIESTEARLLEVFAAAHDLLKAYLNNAAPGPSGPEARQIVPSKYQLKLQLANVTPAPEGESPSTPFEVTFTMPIGNN